MARRKLIWHIGLARAPRAVIGTNLAAYHDELEAADVRVVASADEAGLATHELLRTHRQVGLTRREVEGRWARICDRVWQHKGVSVLSTPDLCIADNDQVREVLNPLIGVEVHLVVTLDSFSQQLYGGWLAELRSGRTTGWGTYVARVLDHAPGSERPHRQGEEFWAGHDLPSILSRWGWTFHADRLHVVADPDVRVQWREFVRLAGLGDVGDLPCVVPDYADPAGMAVLRKVNQQLEDPIIGASADLVLDSDSEPDRAPMPVAPTGALRPMVQRWEKTLAQAGHDVRGDLGALVSEGPERSVAGRRDQLGVAVAALADALAENTRLLSQVRELETERARLDHKRRKWKKRAQFAALG